MKERKPVASSERVSKLIVGLNWGIAALDYARAYLRVTLSALEEFEAMKRTIKRGGHPLSWEDCIKVLRTKELMFVDLIDQLSIEKFQLGRLWLRARTDENLFRLECLKNSIKQELEKHYGLRWYVRLLRPGE